MSGLVLVTAAAALPVDLNIAKSHLKIDDDDTNEDALNMGRIRSAVAYLDGRDGILNRALITQTWDWKLDAFPASSSRGLEVPLPPLQSITSINYTDTAGVSQLWAAAKYQVDTASVPGRILPAFGETWPSTRADMNAVTVRLEAGYGPDPADVPEPIRQAIMVMVADASEQRQEFIVGAIVATLPTVKRLLALYRAVGFP